MFDGLKKSAGKVFGGGEEIDRILSLPITKLRIELKQAFQDKKFTQEQFDDFTARLSQVDDITAQLELAKKAVSDRKVESEIDIELNSPAKQLLWAAALTRMMDGGKSPVAQSGLWKQLKSTIGVHNEAIAVSKVIASSMQNDDTTFDWGQPGSWFYYDPHKNHINLDLYFTLLTGFEHIRSVHLHEIGHSELSNTYSPRMKELYEKVKQYIDPRTVTDEERAKNPPRKMKKSEQLEVGMNVAEWQYRFRLWHMTEDNCVNQFSANMSKMLPQDFAYSLNYVSAILQGFGERLNGDEKTRRVRITTDKPPPTDEKKREIYEDAIKKQQDEAQKEYDAAYKRASSPLSPAEIAAVKKGEITPEVAQKVFNEINTAVLLAYYEKNGMFSGKSDKTWERFHVFPEEIRQLVDVSNVPDAKGRDAFEYLFDLSGGVKKADYDLLSIPLGRYQAEEYLRDNTAVGKAFNKRLAKEEAQLPPGADGRPGKLDEPSRVALMQEVLQQPEFMGAKAPVSSEAEKVFYEQAALEILRAKDVLGATADQTVADSGKDAVENLLEQAAHVRGTRGLQPQPADRMLVVEPYNNVKDSYQNVVAATSVQRGVMMEHIWDLYLKPFADVLLKDYEKKLEERLDQKQKKGQQNKNQQNQQGDQGDQGDPSDQSGDQGEQSENGSPQQQSGGGGGGDSQPDPSQQGGGDGEPDPSGGGSQESDPQQQQGGGGGEEDPELDMDEDLQDQVGDMAENPEEKRDKENAENGAGGQQNDENDPQNQQGSGEGDENKDAAQNDGKDQDGHGGPGWDQDPNEQGQEPKKVGDMKDQDVIDEEMSEQQKEAMKQAAKGMPKVDPNAMKSNNAGDQAGIDLAKLAKGDWTDFNRRILELSPVINQVALSYKRIREAQRRQILQKAKTLDYLPPDGDIQDRLDRDKVLETKFRKATRQKLTTDDAKKFQEDEVLTTESTIEITAMIDGSGSMPSVQLGNGVTAMDVALQSAVINYMACRKAGIDSYIVMWGDPEPLIIATPDSNLKEVGEKLEKLRRGTGSGTSLAPGIVKTIEAMSRHKNKNGTISGSSHILVYSDGDIGDFTATVDKLSIVSKNAKNLSVDVAVLKRPGDASVSKMENAFQTVIDRSGDKLVGIVRGSNAQEVPLELARLMQKRVRRFQVKAENDKEKRRRLKQLHKKLV
ncbi:MAG: hypothetical protein GC185_06540 [Alphaproteobacteria bacterium]|nr:hypothetical protein [Alphaproteobacteria bacterium]